MLDIDRKRLRHLNFRDTCSRPPWTVTTRLGQNGMQDVTDSYCFPISSTMTLTLSTWQLLKDSSHGQLKMGSMTWCFSKRCTPSPSRLFKLWSTGDDTSLAIDPPLPSNVMIQGCHRYFESHPPTTAESERERGADSATDWPILNFRK